MTDRERLITLMQEVSQSKSDYAGNIGLGQIADYLLANGVIVPPCKVGDTVYMVFNNEIIELTVISLSYMLLTSFKQFNALTMNYRGAVLSYEIKDIGKTVFLTLEEAEKALSERNTT